MKVHSGQLKNGMKWLLLTFLLIIFILSAKAEDTGMIDFRNDQLGYGSYVASMTVGNLTDEGKKTRGQSKNYLVLLKTDGRELDMDNLGANCCIAGPGNRFTMVFSQMEFAVQAVEQLKKIPGVIYAETDSEITACDTACADEIFFSTYGAAETGFEWLLSWARKSGSSKVAVIDSGVVQHPFFASRLVSGWDYVENDSDSTNDENGHGTHVAGIIADCTQGTNIQLYSIRVLNSEGRGNASSAANGVLEAIDQRIPVINLSFSSTTSSAFLDDAVQNAVSSGCTVVIAAGNNGINTSGVWPAHLMTDGAIVVGAVNSDGNKASYSNYGSSVDMFFFGTGIRSCSGSGGYETRSGTSQATAHISAACALLKAACGNLSPAEMEARLKTVNGGPQGNIPQMDMLTPQMIPCHLEDFVLHVGDQFLLPVQAYPLTCGESIRWSSTDSQVFVAEDDGRLTAVAPGSAILTGVCANFHELQATVTVTDTERKELCLPEELITLEDEAFLNTDAEYIRFGDKIESIGYLAINPRTLILCAPGTYIAEFAESNGLQYNTKEN